MQHHWQIWVTLMALVRDWSCGCSRQVMMRTQCSSQRNVWHSQVVQSGPVSTVTLTEPMGTCPPCSREPRWSGGRRECGHRPSPPPGRPPPLPLRWCASSRRRGPPGLAEGKAETGQRGVQKRLVFGWRQFLFGGKRINDVLVFLFFDKEMKCL